ncbi:DUF6455 family protein [Pseudophaeobacter sp.]|uniref:DUF6455 family protein n=1 Tax=Pseudophaeobacter sp. TaxID=1971739 RepID=UPI00329A40E6
MQPLGDAMHHLQLLARMGKTLGADLVEAFEKGEISAEDWAEMITSCRGCETPEGCRHWLEAQERRAERTAGAEAPMPPHSCCNAARLMQLRRDATKA